MKYILIPIVLFTLAACYPKGPSELPREDGKLLYAHIMSAKEGPVRVYGITQRDCEWARHDLMMQDRKAKLVKDCHPE